MMESLSAVAATPTLRPGLRDTVQSLVFRGLIAEAKSRVREELGDLRVSEVERVYDEIVKTIE